MALDSLSRDFWIRALRPVGAALARAGVTANGVTVAGLVLTSVAAGLVANGHVFAGGWVLLAGSLADTFDGPVARASGTTSTTGGFFDSVADRLSDGIILAAVAWALRTDALYFAVAVTALVAAQVTSYVRAKAESLGVSCSVGIFERAERAILLMVGLVFHRWLLEPALVLLAVGAVVTVVQRVAHVVPKLRAMDREESATQDDVSDENGTGRDLSETPS